MLSITRIECKSFWYINSIFAKQLLAQRGISPMIDLWEDDLLTRPVFVIEKALKGLQVGERRPV